MTHEEVVAISQGFGQREGELVVAVFGLLWAITKSQPGFDYGKLKEQVETLIDSPDTTSFQKEIWKSFIR